MPGSPTAKKTKRKPSSDPPPLPPQEELLATSLRPGRQVDLILKLDMERDFIDVRSSLLYKVTNNGLLVLAQPKPPVAPSHVGKPLEVTFLSRYHDIPGGRWIRVGYKTKLLKIINDYEVEPGLRDDVLIVPKPKRLELASVRLHYRISPPADREMNLFILPDKQRMPILDISAGGVKFLRPAAQPFPEGSFVKMLLVGEGRKLLLEGQVVRNEDPPKGSRKAATAVRFVFSDPQPQRELSRWLHELLRYELAKRSGLAE